MKIKSAVFALVAMSLGTLFALVSAETVFRLLPVNDGLMAMPVHADAPIFQFSPDRDVTWSRDWNFSIVNRIHVNNAGYVNEQDYVRDGRPLLAIVGDSYIEAAMVAPGETLHGRTAKAVGDTGRVYSFGASGAPLSQYVMWAREAKEAWGANALVIVVIANDFDESLAEYKSAPGFHYYEQDADGDLELHRQDYRPGGIRRMLRKSALFRYLALNLHALERVKALLNTIVSPAQAQIYVGNTAAAAGTVRLQKSRDAIAAFLRDLQAVGGWKPSEVLFLVDDVRYPDENEEIAASYFAKMRNHFMSVSRQQGFGAINLDPHFFARHRSDGSRFEFPTDGHWNGLAHGIAADALIDSAFYSRWVRSLDNGSTR